MMTGARVLVTGAAGFLGANLVRALLDAGAHVIAVARAATDTPRLRQVEPRIRVLRIDLHDLPTTPDLAGVEVDLVYHLASAGVDQRMQDVHRMIASNASGTHDALLAATRLRAQRFVHVGSSAEYGPGRLLTEDHVPAPTGEYGATKVAATLLARAYSHRTGLPVVTVRPFSVYGPWEAAYRLIPYCALRALAGLTVDITDGRQTRDFVFAADVMEGLLLAGSVPEAAGAIVNLSTGVSTSVRDVAETIVALCGSPGASIGVARTHQSTEMWMTSGDPRRAAQILGWQPRTTLEDGLRRTIEWLRMEAAEYPELYGVSRYGA
jgi:nucleoside-diphosphate-sugar epimerase